MCGRDLTNQVVVSQKKLDHAALIVDMDPVPLSERCISAPTVVEAPCISTSRLVKSYQYVAI